MSDHLGVYVPETTSPRYESTALAPGLLRKHARTVPEAKVTEQLEPLKELRPLSPSGERTNRGLAKLKPSSTSKIGPKLHDTPTPMERT